MKKSTSRSRSRARLTLQGSGLTLVLLVATSACGSDVIDAGALTDAGSGGTSTEPEGSGGTATMPAPGSPDAGIAVGDGMGIAIDLYASPGSGPEPPCPIEALRQYRLVFDSDDGRIERRVYAMRADGANLQVLTREDLLAQDPAVSSDGNTVAYSTPGGIEYLDWASGATSLVLPDAEQPSWSREGTRLAFVSSPGVGIGPSDELSLSATYFTQSSYFPSFSADDTSLVYARQSLNDVSQLYSLDRTNITTFESREIVRSSPIRVTRSSVSPDGQWVAAAMECNPNADQPVFSLWVVPYALSSTACEGRPLSGGGNATNPAWGPGALVAFELGDSSRNIAIVDAESGQACVIQLPGDERNPSWVPEALVPPPR